MRKVLCAVLAVLMLAGLCSCDSGKPAPKEYDPQKTADALVNGLEFGDELGQSDNDYTFEKYGIDASLVSGAARYAGSGATADEVAVFSCVDEAAVETVNEAISERISYLHDGYSDYGPSEVPRIDSAKIITEGLTVIFVICSNPEAVEQILDTL